MKHFFTLIIMVFITATSFSQESKNEVYITYGKAFLGTGDIYTPIIGITYNPKIYKNLGLWLNHSIASGVEYFDSYYYNQDEYIIIDGNGLVQEEKPSSGFHHYLSYNIGATYEFKWGRTFLNMGVGLNAKNVKYTYTAYTDRPIFAEDNIPDDGRRILDISHQRHIQDIEMGATGLVRWGYMINDHIALGMIASVETSSNILSYVGGTAGYRF